MEVVDESRYKLLLNEDFEGLHVICAQEFDEFLTVKSLERAGYCIKHVPFEKIADYVKSVAYMKNITVDYELYSRVFGKLFRTELLSFEYLNESYSFYLVRIPSNNGPYNIDPEHTEMLREFTEYCTVTGQVDKTKTFLACTHLIPESRDFVVVTSLPMHYAKTVFTDKNHNYRNLQQVLYNRLIRGI